MIKCAPFFKLSICYNIFSNQSHIYLFTLYDFSDES